MKMTVLFLFAVLLFSKPALAGDWNYFTQEDEMTGKPSFFARIVSTNTVQFDWPYGEQRGELVLRTHPRWGKSVYFSVAEGQILCNSWDGCSVLVRFGDKAPESCKASEPADYSSNLIFIQNYSSFVGKMMKSEVVKISVPFYQEGNPVFIFDVSGFNADKYLGKKPDF